MFTTKYELMHWSNECVYKSTHYKYIIVGSGSGLPMQERELAFYNMLSSSYVMARHGIGQTSVHLQGLGVIYRSDKSSLEQETWSEQHKT